MSSQPMPEVPGVEHRYVDTGEVTLHVAEAGSGEPIVLVHGWPQHWWEWRELIGPLAEGRRVICPDLRGFGWSEAPGHGYDPHTFAKDLIGLLDAEGIKQADLVGHDWGGLTVGLAALEYPQRVRRLMVLNMIAPFIHAPLLKTAATAWRFWYQWAVSLPLINVPVTRSIERRFNPIADWMGGGREAWPWEVRQVFGRQFRDPARAQATTALYRWLQVNMLSISRGAHNQGRFEMPARFLVGDADRVVRPVLLEGVERHGTDVEVEFVPGVGHFIVDERPELVFERARAFLIDPGQD